MERKQAPIP
ncbi:hypothetical protein Nmel_009093 [Mimus melanotis]